MEIAQRHEIHFVEIGADEDHVHFLVQSVPVMSPKAIVQIIKSTTAREIFRTHTEVKKMLWGGKFWTSGYYANTEPLVGSVAAFCGGHYKPLHIARKNEHLCVPDKKYISCQEDLRNYRRLHNISASSNRRG